MSEWRGLANPEWHDPNKRAKGWAWCEGDCNTTCHKDELCRCCLAAEVERLTEALADREAAIARVREECDFEDAWWLDVGEHAGTNDRGELPFVEVHAILRALDGGDDE